jgi:hypothetical protein
VKKEFTPAFGSRPLSNIKRRNLVSQFGDGLQGASGDPLRTVLYVGQRGMGKTALLLDLAAIAKENDYIVARVTAGENMLEEIIQTIQLSGEHYLNDNHQKVKSVSAGAGGAEVKIRQSLNPI